MPPKTSSELPAEATPAPIRGEGAAAPPAASSGSGSGSGSGAGSGADCTLKATGGRWSGWTALGIADKNGHGDSMAAILRQPWGGRRADAAGSAPEPELDWGEPLADQVQSHDALIAAAAEFLADPLTASAPLEQKSRYLRKKHGLTQAEVDLACTLAAR